uniref:Dermokine n=1 Tax=Oryctolagus cuniculus TaxID=9986 RepID=G1TLS4_RABIT
MKLQGSLACLLLALCLGSGEAGPLLNGGENTGASAAEAIGQRLGDAVSHGIGEAVGRGAGEAAGSGTREVLGQGGGEAAGSGTREAGDTVNYRLGEAVHDLGNSGGEAGRQAETIVRQGIDAVHSSGSWGSSGGHGILDSQGSNPGGPGTPWGQRYPGASEGSFGTYSPGGSSGQGGNGAPFGSGTDAQGAVAQPGYGSVRGSNPNTGVRGGVCVTENRAWRRGKKEWQGEKPGPLGRDDRGTGRRLAGGRAMEGKGSQATRTRSLLLVETLCQTSLNSSSTPSTVHQRPALRLGWKLQQPWGKSSQGANSAPLRRDHRGGRRAGAVPCS